MKSLHLKVIRRLFITIGIGLWLIILPSPLLAQNVALLLYDSETGRDFVGCLNCNRYASESVCNKYGDYGSRYSTQSIWNRYGKFGSRYNTNSPWNRYGKGLKIVDTNGNYYGLFSISQHGKSTVPLVQLLLETYKKNDDLDILRDLLCK